MNRTEFDKLFNAWPDYLNAALTTATDTVGPSWYEATLERFVIERLAPLAGDELSELVAQSGAYKKARKGGSGFFLTAGGRRQRLIKEGVIEARKQMVDEFFSDEEKALLPDFGFMSKLLNDYAARQRRALAVRLDGRELAEKVVEAASAWLDSDAFQGIVAAQTVAGRPDATINKELVERMRAYFIKRFQGYSDTGHLDLTTKHAALVVNDSEPVRTEPKRRRRGQFVQIQI